MPAGGEAVARGVVEVVLAGQEANELTVCGALAAFELGLDDAAVGRDRGDVRSPWRFDRHRRFLGERLRAGRLRRRRRAPSGFPPAIVGDGLVLGVAAAADVVAGAAVVAPALAVGVAPAAVELPCRW